MQWAIGASAQASGTGPPRPNPKFTRSDLKRIKQTGPTINDLFVHFEVETKDKDGRSVENIYDFVPAEVLGTGYNYDPEPEWSSIPQMAYMEFYKGLRERNWTSEYYNPDADPWKLQFFEDAGKFLRPSFTGYRVLLTKSDGSRAWVAIENAGTDTFLRDYMGGGGPGGIWRSKRSGPPLGSPSDYGYNQVFEQLFQAYEQRLSPAGQDEIQQRGWSDKTVKTNYRCPADHLLDVSFNLTPPERSLHTFWEALPVALFYGFGISFLGVALAIGIFRPRRQMPTDMFQAMEFAQSKGQARKDGSTGVKFSDVGGLGATVNELQEAVEFLKAPAKYAALDARPPKGILLSGDPGVGKTLIAKAVAGEAGVPFYQMAGSEFVEAIVGVGAARVRDLFKRARAQAPCIIFVDEIDALGIRRAPVGVQTNEEREQTLNQLLSEMDGFAPDAGVVFIAATNRPDLLDPALLRAGRFDRNVTIRRPDEGGREEILRIHARKHAISPDVDLRQLAKDLPGLSGAELGNVLNEAALEAVRRQGDVITPQDVGNAVDRVLQGIRRPPLPDRFAVKRAMALHEAGTSIVATCLHRSSGRIERVERVSMVPRGRDWSRTIYARAADEAYLIMTRGRLMDRIRVILAGRAAEEVALGEATTYGLLDLRDATKLALRLIANYGLDPVVGIPSYSPPTTGMGFMQKSFEVTVDNIDSDLFGDAIPGGSFQPSDEERHAVKMRAREILKEAYEANIVDLKEQRAALEAVAEALMEQETLSGEELERIYDETMVMHRKDSQTGQGLPESTTQWRSSHNDGSVDNKVTSRQASSFPSPRQSQPGGAEDGSDQ